MTIKYQDLLKEIKNELQSLYETEELSAIITHWLQSPYQNPPLMGEKHLAHILAFLKSKKISLDLLYSNGLNEERQNHHLMQDSSLWKDIPYPPPRSWDFTFIDLFAGIGGFRQAFQNAGGKCVFSSEWDKFAKITYLSNYGETPYGDIRKIPKGSIPDHDVLCAGFPCQPFSLAGVSKKNSLGQKHGFEDETQGTLFFEIKEILRIKRPKAFMLENVKNILSHDMGKTFEIIRATLEDNLGYIVKWRVVDGVNWVPQHRERIFIIGYDPKQINIKKSEINIPDKPDKEYRYPELSTMISKKLDGYTIGPGTWKTLERHKAHHLSKGNGFGYGLHRLNNLNNSVTRTISARYHKDGAEILIEQKDNRPRKLSVEEAMQLQGFNPDNFIFPVSKTQAYRQIGNSVVIPAVHSSAVEISKVIKNSREHKG